MKDGFKFLVQICLGITQILLRFWENFLFVPIFYNLTKVTSQQKWNLKRHV